MAPGSFAVAVSLLAQRSASVRAASLPWLSSAGFGLGLACRVACVAYLTRWNWLPTNVAIRSRAAHAARGGPESLSRAPIRRRRKGALGLGSRGDRSVFWMRNVPRAWGSIGPYLLGCKQKSAEPCRACAGQRCPATSLAPLGRTTGVLGAPVGGLSTERAAIGPRASLRTPEECYLVDPASSHMLVSKIKPCMCKYEQIQTVKLRMAH